MLRTCPNFNRPLIRCCAAMALVGAALLSGCATKNEQVDIAAMFCTKGALAPVENPIHVEIYRVDPKPVILKPGVNHIGGFVVAIGPVDAGHHTSKELSQLFSSQSSYRWREVPPKCEFKPLMAIRFIDEDKARTDLLLGFGCNEMAVIHQGQRVGTGYFDKSRDKIIEILKRLFPNDGYVKKLKMAAG